MLDILDAPPQKLPVTIVTGFLGSGKTTLLNHIIQNFEGYKVAVLVNEFGDINIDSQLLIKVGDDEDKNTIELTNGCICCTINDDFADAVYRILTRRDRIDYLVIETTGVANPLPIAMTFLGTELRDFTHLDSIVTVVDAESFTPIEHYNSDVAIDQIFCGDIIILNKTDLVSEERANKVEDFLKSVKEGARILRSAHSIVPLSLLLDTNLSDPDFFDKAMTDIDVDSQHLNNDGFMSISFQSNRPIVLKKFQQFLDHQLPENVFRAKGILWFDESPLRHIFQLSGKRFSIDDSEWVDPPKNQMVLIGRKLDKLFLMQSLNNCLG
ncbi:GTP-binding protein [Chamaesiphon sp.]|uniref:CobW family GTP-binding protein n=1 Tax=Chamaesiphon sp. TaxID=2814140 RepID=UPI00359367DF